MNLTLDNCVEFVRSSTPEAVKAAVQEMNHAEEAQKSALSQKCAAYFASKEQRYQRIVDQIRKAQGQREAVEAEKATHNQALVNATLSGDDETVTAIQQELERCESALASFTAQIEMFRAYQLDGDPELSAEIERDRAALKTLIDGNKAIREAVFQVTEEIKRAWASAVYDPDAKGVALPWNHREPWEIKADRVRDDQREKPVVVGAKLDAASADAKTAAARQQGATAPRAVFLPGQ